MKSLNLTQGSVFKTLFFFSLPLIATNIVQLLFHAADVAVLGIMVSDAAVAAVGACGSLINLLLSLFSGLSTGANILVANRVGAMDENGARRATGTSLVIALLSGLIMMAIALVGAKQFLIWISCQPSVLEDAALYMRIYFLGMPIIMLYNFTAAILRATGDSVRPMSYMMIAGVLNVVLNVLFIALFRLEVVGVALATLLSNLVALVLALRALLKNEDYCKVEKKNLRMRKNETMQIVRVGVPASLGGLCFYVANLFIASAVNSLSENAMTANAISSTFDGVVYSVGLSIAIACMSMVGQAMGARNAPRLSEVIRAGIVYATSLSLGLGTIMVLLSEPLLYIMTDDSDIVAIAKEKMMVLCFTYFITSIMEVLSFALRAMGRNKSITAVCFVCGFLIRSAWVLFLVPLHNTLGMIYLAIPVSALVALVIYLFLLRGSVVRLKAEFAVPLPLAEETPVEV